MNSLKISISDLKVSYGDFLALEIPALQAEGNIISIIGHNGSGKSTLIKTMLGIITPQSGSVVLSLADKLDPQRDMAFSPENGAVFSDMPVQEYLELWCRLKYDSQNYYREDGQAIMERLKIPVLYSKLGRELSKGLRRRVQVAVGFLLNPRLFLFDEPFDGLDVLQVSELASIFEERRNEMAFIVSSHRMDVVEELSDVVIVLKEGRLCCYGTVKEVCNLLSKGRLRNPSLLDAINYDLRVNETINYTGPVAAQSIQAV